MGGAKRRELSVCRDQVTEAHGEISKHANGERIQVGSCHTGEARHGLLDYGPFGWHERRSETPDMPCECKPPPAWHPAQRRREPIKIRAIVGVRVPALPCPIDARRRSCRHAQADRKSTRLN